jgi:transcriptional regulator with XRE-family HTH domain
METEKWFKGMIESFKEDLDFRLETVILDLTEKISKRMKEKGINRTKLAELLKVSPPAVTKILNGNSNFTLKTLLSLADALELELKIDFRQKGIVASIPSTHFARGIVPTSEKLGFDTVSVCYPTITAFNTISNPPLSETEEDRLPQAVGAY